MEELIFNELWKKNTKESFRYEVGGGEDMIDPRDWEWEDNPNGAKLDRFLTVKTARADRKISPSIRLLYEYVRLS